MSCCSSPFSCSSAPPPSWSVPEWFIDPQNVTGHASDQNDGVTASTPLLTFAAVVERWGTESPVLRQNTTLFFLSSQTDDLDPVILNPILANPIGNTSNIVGASLFIKGTNNVLASGTFVSVPQTKSASFSGGNLLWQVDLGVAPGAFVHKLLHNITQNSICEIRRVVSGTIVELSQPLTNAGAQGTQYNFIDVVNPGDAWEILDVVSVNAVSLLQTIDHVQLDAPTQVVPVNGVCCYRVRLFDPPGGPNNLDIGYATHIRECIVDRSPQGVDAENSVSFDKWFVNNVYTVGVFNAGNIGRFIGGIYAGPFTEGGFRFHLDGGIILEAGIRGAQLVELGNFYIAAGQTVNCAFGGFDSSVMTPIPAPRMLAWGPGNLDLGAFGSTYYKRSADSYVASLQLSGAITVGRALLAQAYNANANKLFGPLALNPADLDLAVGTTRNVAVISGATASITAAAGGKMTLTGLTGITRSMIGYGLVITGAASGGNNGTFPITDVLSSTSVMVSNGAAVAPDANNGAISWGTQATGVAASITAFDQVAGKVTLTGLTGLTTASVGHDLIVTGAATANNNGTFRISNFISATSCQVENPLGVAPDANNGAIHWQEATVGFGGTALGLLTGAALTNSQAQDA